VGAVRGSALKGRAMARRYGAFLLRGWRLGDGDRRFEIAHIQSGESTRATTLEEVIAWVGACLEADQVPGDGRHNAEAPDEQATPDAG
jgi:hypothetical protein